MLFPVGWIITWFSVIQDFFNIVDSLVNVPLWVLNHRLHEFFYHGLVFLWCSPDVKGCLQPCLQGDWDNTVLQWNQMWDDNKELFLSEVILKHLLHFIGLPSFFFLEGRHWRFIRQSFMSLSSISNECDDSFLFLLSELLPTLVAFFPTKDELTSLHKGLDKVSSIELRGPST